MINASKSFAADGYGRDDLTFNDRAEYCAFFRGRVELAKSGASSRLISILNLIDHCINDAFGAANIRPIRIAIGAVVAERNLNIEFKFENTLLCFE